MYRFSPRQQPQWNKNPKTHYNPHIPSGVKAPTHRPIFHRQHNGPHNRHGTSEKSTPEDTFWNPKGLRNE